MTSVFRVRETQQLLISWTTQRFLRSRKMLLVLTLSALFIGNILLYHLKNRYQRLDLFEPETSRFKNGTTQYDSIDQSRFNMCRSFCERPFTFAEPELFHPMGETTGVNNTECVLVYSAYFDKRDPGVKILTDSDLKCYQSVAATCRVWYHGYSDPYVTVLSFGFTTLEENPFHLRLGVVYYCSTPPDLVEQPYAVSFIWDKWTGKESQNLKPLAMKVSQLQPPLYTFTVCVPPLFGINLPENLVEFIEFHRILGAEKFYFYNDSISKQCESILQPYINQGLVQVMNWKSIYPNIVKYQNQQIMQIDCMYRNLQQTKYVAQIDTDEILLTHNGSDWHEMVRKIGTNDTAAFVFLNRFYSLSDNERCPQGNAAEKSGSANFVPSSLRRLAYYDVYFAPDVRSKIIYRPDAVYRVRTHYAHPLPGYKIAVVNRDVGSLNHYRNKNFDFVLSKSTISDFSICIYGKDLQFRIRERMSQTNANYAVDSTML